MAQSVISHDPTLLIDRNGNFNSRIEELLKLKAKSSPILAVSIIGVQSSGKSTLLNHLFGTGFRMMDDSQGMAQTTQGIWVAKYSSSTGGCQILVIDTEGSDGHEREDDVKFEKQTALFSLAISNTVIMNMKCDNVNLNNGGGRPLLRTVFEVIVRKFSTPRKVNLVFVLRDKNRVPLHKLEEQLKAGMDKIWKEMTKPQAQANASLEDYFHIKVVALPHFWLQEEEFIAEVASLKERIMYYTASSELAKERIAASGFADYAKSIWDQIKEDKELDLPQQRIMVAQVRCDAIGEENYQSFCKNEDWDKIKMAALSHPVQGFGKDVSKICDYYLSRYDEETRFYDQTKRDESKARLTERTLQVIEKPYLALVEHMYRATLQKFQKKAADEMIKDPALVMNMKTDNFITEFQNQLEDADIQVANWKHAKKFVTQLEKEILSLKERVRAVEELLKQKKKNRVFFWKKVVAIGAHLFNVAISVAVMVLIPGIGTAVGGSAVGASTLAIVALLVKENPETAKSLAPTLESILKQA